MRSFKQVTEFFSAARKYTVENRLHAGLISLCLVVASGLVYFGIHLAQKSDNNEVILPQSTNDSVSSTKPGEHDKKLDTAVKKPAPKPAKSVPKIQFGMGPTAKSHYQSALDKSGKIKLLTTWFNKPVDLNWMSSWHGWIEKTYHEGYAHQLIVYSTGPSGNVSTKYGNACGSKWAVSSTFISDFKKAIEIFSGNGPLYVSMFSELQTYPCSHNQWAGNENYYRALIDNHKQAIAIAGKYQNVYISGPVWGGWQHRWDDPDKGGGSSLMDYFDEVSNLADYQAFQAMSSDHKNADDILAMTERLNDYSQPVMLAHYKPDDGSAAVWDLDMELIFTDDYMSKAISKGLFAFSFMDSDVPGTSQARMKKITNITNKYGTNSLSFTR